MAKYYDTLRGWVRAWQQPATYLGAAMIAAIWASFAFHLAVERDRLQSGAVKNTSNLARVFEEHIVNILRETDRTLLLLRTAYLAGPADFDLIKWLANPALHTDLISHIAMTNAEGLTIASSLGPLASPVDVSDRRYFSVQRESSKDEMFIGEPTVGRIVGKKVIQISRGIRAANGAFLGVILATIDSQYLTQFYESVDVGNDGAIVLVGLDGIVRASAGFKGDIVGNSLKRSQLFSKISAADSGWFLTAGNQDAIKRFVSYRVVKSYPLVVYAGEAENEVMAPYWRDRKWYYAISSAATVVVLMVVALAIRYQKRLIATQEALQKSEARERAKSHALEATLENMNQGIVMIDENHDVVVVNRRLLELLDLPKELLSRIPQGIKSDEALAQMWAAGEYGKEGEAINAKIQEMILTGGISAAVPIYERTRPNGTILEVRAVALPDGGVVRTFTDISERKRRELQINHMARHDALTGLANRTLVTEQLNQALARMRRDGRGLALLYLDLDRFKAVNDARGHAVGDALLCAVAKRLSDCVREIDTVARLGGDEFVILLASIEREEDVEIFARRVLASVIAPYDLSGYCAVIGTSIGVAMAPGDGATAEVLLENADAALYRAKSGGGNAYQFFGRTEVEAHKRKKTVAQGV